MNTLKGPSSKAKIAALAFALAFVYVLAGTLSVLALPRQSPLHVDWAAWVALVTLPANLLGFAVLFTESYSQRTVLVVIALQTLTFFAYWFAGYFLLYKVSKRSPPSPSSSPSAK